MIFPLPSPDAAFRARWRAKMRRAHDIWLRSCVDYSVAGERRQAVARRVLDVLYRQRDAIVAGNTDPKQ
jgi:hypothetical protein